MPRLKVTLTDQQYDLLHFVAKATDQTMSGVMQDLFDTAAPTLKRIAELAEAARRAPKEFHQGMVASLEAAEARLAPLLAQATEAFDAASDAVERPRKARPGGGEGSPPAGRRPTHRGGQPPLSNTGVRSTVLPPKTHKTGSSSTRFPTKAKSRQPA